MINFKKQLKNIQNYVPGKPIEEVKRELKLKAEIFKLASNENPLGPSPKALKVVKDSLNQINFYPDDNNFYLKKRLSEKLKVKEEMLILGNGSVEIINSIIFSFTEKKDRVLRPSPSFIMFKISSLINGCKIVEIPHKNFKNDVSSIVNAIKKSKFKIVYLDNPNNPLGSMIFEDELKYLLRNVPSDTLVLLDEAYNDYMDDRLRIDSTKFLKKYKNLIILRTFSKIYGLAGLRIGYGVANGEIVSVLQKVRLPFNVNLLAQKAALAAIDDYKHLKESKKLNDKGIKFLTENLKKMGFFVIDSYTNFVTFDCGCDSKVIFEKLQKKGVIVRPIDNYGLKTFLRVTTSTERGNKIFVEKLKEVLDEVR
ncbi:MAG: Histidinol-phosphate aminotransferase [candidate division TA06 bacterium 32_111]|uniref:Histidinol-phosphate aminotransferase n=2 Tax=Bacteria candidate phyla TaxID=1783234 RepID=A0A101I147_UNCT6|nr:MAG: Histidinol-phosphate aminotransferase [candidate division TA06 bacterium 32_111]KUK86723.1 MAG: Histidinol-phosphate aminotransferase [candidate division TA06 bacterium 34_109]HAF08341.1 histidinol-phosphate transaminase [candidate division WOR-3 bacterium]HCP16427.1 histidinol-phosphate transaminase [candidate division WOR-3 bacterium]